MTISKKTKMMDSVFNFKILREDKTPWLSTIFQKSFDAYFFLPYPLMVYSEAELPFNLFHFINNLGQNTLHVTTTDRKQTLSFQNKNWDLQPFWLETREKLSDENCLCWSGSEPNWAMVSFKQAGFAVLGVDWTIAGQPTTFWSDYFLSPKQVIQQAEIAEQDQAVFLKNYAPTAILTEGGAENPLWDMYFFDCRVEEENDKLFYWKAFEPLFEALSPIMKPFGTIKLYAGQAFERIYYRNKQWYSTLRAAPVGGWQKFSKANFEKVANKFLPNNLHLQHRFEGKMEDAQALFNGGKTELIYFMGFMIYAYVDKVKQTGHLGGFHFLYDLYGHADKKMDINQQFRYNIRCDLVSEEALTQLNVRLSEIGFAIKVHHVRQPQVFAQYTLEKPLNIEGIYSATPDDTTLIINNL